MSGNRRKSHGMLTRFDTSHGWNCDTSSRPGDFTVKENRVNPIHSPKIKIALPSPSRYDGLRLRRNSMRITRPVPFSFESRDVQLLGRRDERVHLAELEAKRMANSFRARPMPVGQVDRLPEASSRDTTLSCPFQFRLDERAKTFRSTHSSFTSLAEQPIRSLPPPKSPSVLYRAPFYPKPTDRPPLAPIHIELATTDRVLKRRQFDDAIERKRVSMDRKRRIAETEASEQEHLEIKQLRTQLVHRPGPIRHYRHLNTPPAKMPTVAKTPNFGQPRNRATRA